MNRNDETISNKIPARGGTIMVAGLALVFQTFLNGVTHTGGHPHYYNATWFCGFALVWFAYSLIRNAAWRRVLAGGHALALLVVTLALVWNIHRTQGNVNIHSDPTLRTQMAVLDELSRYHPQSEIVNETAHYRNFPTHSRCCSNSILRSKAPTLQWRDSSSGKRNPAETADVWWW
ncbi:MAG: hypothetical protein RLZZ350_346 [Verrucomicrobiota bacterium]